MSSAPAAACPSPAPPPPAVVSSHLPIIAPLLTMTIASRADPAPVCAPSEALRLPHPAQAVSGFSCVSSLTSSFAPLSSGPATACPPPAPPLF
eukprot:4017926-Pyramimonas_sp.AAC.1